MAIGEARQVELGSALILVLLFSMIWTSLWFNYMTSCKPRKPSGTKQNYVRAKMVPKWVSNSPLFDLYLVVYFESIASEIPGKDSTARRWQNVVGIQRHPSRPSYHHLRTESENAWLDLLAGRWISNLAEEGTTYRVLDGLGEAQLESLGDAIVTTSVFCQLHYLLQLPRKERLRILTFEKGTTTCDLRSLEWSKALAHDVPSCLLLLGVSSRPIVCNMDTNLECHIDREDGVRETPDCDVKQFLCSRVWGPGWRVFDGESSSAKHKVTDLDILSDRVVNLSVVSVARLVVRE